MSLEQIARDIREGTFPRKSDKTLQEEQNERLRKAMEEAKVLIGAINDNAPAAIRDSNINRAWHILDSTSASPPEQPPSPLRGRDELIEQCVKIALAGAKQCVDGDTEWHRGFKYAASNTALGIADSICALSASPPEQPADDQ